MNRLCSVFAYLIISITSVVVSVSHSVSHANGNSGDSSAGIFPTRIAIGANEKTASLTLRNTSKVEVSYRMNLVEMGLDSSGAFRQLNSDEIPANQRSVDKVVRFSPRQVRLKPGATQVVRVIVRRSAMKEAGEYRSHLLLQALPILSEESLSDSAKGDAVLVQSSAGLSVGVTVPIIVRHKKTDAVVSLKKVIIDTDDSGKAISTSVLLGLNGNRSTYGDITLSLVNNGRERVVGNLNSFALYYPYPEEWIRMPFKKNLHSTDVNKNTKIRVRFKNGSSDSKKDYWLDDLAQPLVR